MDVMTAREMIHRAATGSDDVDLPTAAAMLDRVLRDGCPPGPPRAGPGGEYPAKGGTGECRERHPAEQAMIAFIYLQQYRDQKATFDLYRLFRQRDQAEGDALRLLEERIRGYTDALDTLRGQGTAQSLAKVAEGMIVRVEVPGEQRQ